MFSRFLLILYFAVLSVNFLAPKSYAAQPVKGSWTFVGTILAEEVVVAPNNPNIFYAVTNNGLLKSIDGGVTWSSIYNTTGITHLAVAPSDSGIIYAGGYGYSPILKSIDGGETWTDVTNGLPITNNGGSYPALHTILIHPNNPNRVYLGLTTACSGLWSTVDGGKTWTHANGLGCDTQALAYSPSNPNTIYWGGGSPSGTTIHKSIDNAATWTNPSGTTLGNLFGYSVLSIAVDSGNPNMLYAGGWYDNGKVYKSSDGGANWMLISSLNVFHNLITDPASPNAVYYASSSAPDVYMSIDGGLTSTNIRANLPNTTIKRLQISKNPNTLYALTNEGLYAYSLENENSPLPVPLLKQTSDPWQGQEYDSAHLWSPANPTINRWGCAMTSAAMVFQFHGIKKLPDGTSLDPGTLNTWLKNQTDGYVREGWVNWLALSRLSKLAKNVNGIGSFDGLEYTRKNGADRIQLVKDLNNEIPGILEEPGHFIVAKGIDGDTFSINDPYYDRETLNDGYSNTFVSLGRFIPSNTDLSYIMIVADSDINLTLLDGDGNEIEKSFVQQPVVDPQVPGNKNEPISILYAPKLNTENYRLIVSGSPDKISSISAYLYDTDGNPYIAETLNLGNNSYRILFNKNGNNKDAVDKTVTFASVIADINTLDKNKLINRGLAKALRAHISASQKQFKKGHIKISGLILNQAINLLKITRHNKKLISEESYELLSIDLEALKKINK